MKSINQVTPNGWVNLSDIRDFLAVCGVKDVGRGERENQTDGEAHWICEASDRDRFELHANYYDAIRWRPLLEWANKKRIDAESKPEQEGEKDGSNDNDRS